MSPTTTPSHCHDAHRMLPPEETLARLLPHLSDFGITRCADVTRLDVDLGVPVHMAIRPRGRVFQSSAGKGLSVAAAKVSALMEAVELDVAERPEPARLRRASRAELVAEGKQVDALPEWSAAAGRFFSDHFRIFWVEAEDLLRGSSVWVPAGAAYFCEPTPCRTNTSGLSAGNHLVEATLHGLYEVIERDAVARLIEGDRISIGRACKVIDLASVSDPHLARMVEQIEKAETKLVLLRVLSGLPVPTFWAVMLNKQPFASISTLNIGYGAHLDPTVASMRAISEAVQSRLTMIHGSRDDIVTKPVYTNQVTGWHDVGRGAAFQFFDSLEPTTQADFTAYHVDVHEALSTVLSLLQKAGHERVYRVDLRCPVPDFSVVKVLSPSLRLNTALF